MFSILPLSPLPGKIAFKIKCNWNFFSVDILEDVILESWEWCFLVLLISLEGKELSLYAFYNICQRWKFSKKLILNILLNVSSEPQWLLYRRMSAWFMDLTVFLVHWQQNLQGLKQLEIHPFVQLTGGDGRGLLKWRIARDCMEARREMHNMDLRY
jgi:hypothetical protein